MEKEKEKVKIEKSVDEEWIWAKYRNDKTKYAVSVIPHSIDVAVYTYPDGTGKHYIDCWIMYRYWGSELAPVYKQRWDKGWVTGREGIREMSPRTVSDFLKLAASTAERLKGIGNNDPALVEIARDVVKAMGCDFVTEEGKDLMAYEEPNGMER